MNQISPVPEKQQTPRQSVLDSVRQQRLSIKDDLARRSWRVTLLKWILPGLAVLLLVVLAVAPSWHLGADSNRVTYHLSTNNADNGTSSIQDATYHGRDQQGQPYVVTAAKVVQQSAGTALLTSPQGNITLKSGAWLMLKSASGAYHQKNDTLDLTGDVTLYRNDGTLMTTDHAVVDLRAGVAMSTAPVQVSGPFGTLEAQNGFTLADHGDQIMFHGPAKLVLNQEK